MMELYVLDQNLYVKGVLPFKSLIWIDRYNRVGSCEVYAPATENNVNLLQTGMYLKRSDKTSVYLIKYVKRSGNEDSGEFVTVFGYDAKCLIDQRINQTQEFFQSYDNAGDDWVLLLQNNVLDASAPNPFLKENGYPLFSVRPPTTAAFGTCNQSIRYLSWGDATRQLCGFMGYGYAVGLIDSSAHLGDRELQFTVYAGLDKSRSVYFSKTFGNLGQETYEKDTREIGNVIYVKSDESTRVVQYGSAFSTERVEKWLPSSTSPLQTLDSLQNIVEGTLVTTQVGTAVRLAANNLYIPILSDWQLTQLRSQYGSGSTTQRPGYYYVASNAFIGMALNTQLSAVTGSTQFQVDNGSGIFDLLLLMEAAEQANHYGLKEEISAEITGRRFIFGTDYNLGDLVTVQSKYGDPAIVRIVEVMECWDENGYILEPRTSYTDV